MVQSTVAFVTRSLSSVWISANTSNSGCSLNSKKPPRSSRTVVPTTSSLSIAIKGVGRANRPLQKKVIANRKKTSYNILYKDGNGSLQELRKVQTNVPRNFRSLQPPPRCNRLCFQSPQKSGARLPTGGGGLPSRSGRGKQLGGGSSHPCHKPPQ